MLGGNSNYAVKKILNVKILFQVIREAIWLLKDNTESIERGLAILNEHAGLEGCDIDEEGLCEIDVLHPKYLPRKEMLSLLVDLLTHMAGNKSIQTQNAVSALIAVCNSASNKPGLAKASDDELEILFTALKNESECVRDAALRGLDALEDSVPYEPSNPLYMVFVQRLWVSRYDPIPEHQLLSDNLWDKHNLQPYNGLQEDVINDVVYPGSNSIRTAASLALSKCPELDAGSSLGMISHKKSLKTIFWSLTSIKSKISAPSRILTPAHLCRETDTEG